MLRRLLQRFQGNGNSGDQRERRRVAGGDQRVPHALCACAALLLYAKADGALLCAHRTVLLDFAASEARQREQQTIQELSNPAGDYNNQPLELRLERLLEGVATLVPYKTVELKLQRPFSSDFNDF